MRLNRFFFPPNYQMPNYHQPKQYPPQYSQMTQPYFPQHIQTCPSSRELATTFQGMQGMGVGQNQQQRCYGLLPKMTRSI